MVGMYSTCCADVAPAPATTGRRLVVWLAKLARELVQWRRDCYELRLLLAMDDSRLLRDMGVNRYDLHEELHRPFWDWAGRD